jgi:hypothetical protein
MADGLTDWRKASKPASWDVLAKTLEHSANAVLRVQVRDLSVFFGDGRALDAAKNVALNLAADLNETMRRASYG